MKGTRSIPLAFLLVFSFIAFANFGFVPTVRAAADYSEQGYFDLWNTTFRVDVNYSDYWSGSTFDYLGFFAHVNTTYIDTFLYSGHDWSKPWNYTRHRPDWSWDVPTYNPGDNVSNIESKADYVIYQNASGFVFYNKTGDGGNPFGGDDVYATDEFEDVSNDWSNGDNIFIKEGIFTFPTRFTPSDGENITIAGSGWNTVLKLDAHDAEEPIQNNIFYADDGGAGGEYLSHWVIRDLTVDGNRVNQPTDGQLAPFYPNAWDGNSLAYINVNFTDCAKKTAFARIVDYTFVINCYSKGAGWNGFESTWSTNSLHLGNLALEYRDVGWSSWGSNNTMILNSILHTVVNDTAGFGGFAGAFGILTEPSTGVAAPNNQPSTNIYIRNCIVNNNTHHEPTRGNGLRFGSAGDREEDVTYNTIVDNCTFRFNKWNIVDDPQADYTDNNIVFYDVDSSFPVNANGSQELGNWKPKRPDEWLIETHSATANGWVAYELTYQTSAPWWDPQWDNYSITLHSETASNLSFTLEGNSDFVSTTTESTCKVYHTGITASWRVDFNNGTVADALDYYNSTEGILTMEFEFASGNQFVFDIYETGVNSVVLNAPADSAELNQLTDVLFNYTPTFFESIVNSSLWLNVSGTWQSVNTNSTPVLNNTLNTLNYTFSTWATYIWNVEVWNSTHAVWAESNRTLIIQQVANWSHTIMGVSNIGKIGGVDIAAIEKVNGVSA